VISRMTGFPVKSNSTGMIHAETFLDIGGTIQLQMTADNQTRLVNGSDYNLVNAGIVHGSDDGTFQFATVGNLSAGDSVDLAFEERHNANLYSYWKEIPEFVSANEITGAIWDRVTENAVSIPLSRAVELAPVEDRDRASIRDFLLRTIKKDSIQRDEDLLVGKELFQEALTRFGTTGSVYGTGVGELFEVISKDLKLAPGQTRLIGEIRQPVGLHQLKPAATQNTQSTLVVVHLQPAALPVARPDTNALQDFLAAPDQDRWEKQFDEDRESGYEDGGGGDEDGMVDQADK
jgi:hypothetical protein